jgi:threonine/homoserine/homoserine lactone efflux protein
MRSITARYAAFCQVGNTFPRHQRLLIDHPVVMDLLLILRSGVAVGLAAAMPFGPIGLTVVALGRKDWRSGVAAAAGVATADLTWATAAVAGGAVLAAHPAVSLWRAAAQGLLLAVGVVLVVHGVHQFRRRRAPAAVATAPRTPGRYFVALYGLTLPNPLTVAIFTAAAVDVGLRNAGTPGQRAVFVVAVGVTSLTWQLALAALGRHVLARAGSAVSAALTICGGLVLVAWPLITR